MPSIRHPNAPRGATQRNQRGFTLIEMMTVVVILGILAAVAIGAYSKHVRNAHKSQVIADLSNISLRQKNFMAISGHYASSTDCEGAACTYPPAGDLMVAKAPIEWDPTDAGYTAIGAGTGQFMRGGEDLNGFDALRFLPEGGFSYCGYATVSGYGAQWAVGTEADTPPVAEILAGEMFPAGTDPYFARDWFYTYALCDFDYDGTYWAFTTAHYASDVNSSEDGSGTYLENE